jgi:phenylalanyl-tRNA synthetase beta chain
VRISLNWLKEFVDLPESVDDLTQTMTMLGMEVEKVERPGDEITGVLVGQVTSLEPHPDADRLVVCKTDVGGEEPLQIVCGAKNFKVGDKVPTATVGGTLPGGFAIGKRKMRGVESQGMMCSAKELGLGEDHDGLLILDSEIELGRDVKGLFGLDDIIIEIEVTPNRGDWAGIIGISRELAAYYKTDVKSTTPSISESEAVASKSSTVTVEAPDLCPRYCGRVLTNVKVGPSPAWMVQRLIGAGQRPINNIVDITNYVLLETGHPLHAFDLSKLHEERIVVRQAKAGETIVTLDKEARTLDEAMLVIADGDAPVAVAGVIGGLDSEVTETTDRVFLESACFDPKSVRRTARSLSIITEASQRFQRGADPEMVAYAVDRAAELMEQVADAQVARGHLDEYPGKDQARSVSLRYGRTEAVLAASIGPDRQKSILTALGFSVIEDGEEECKVEVPSWRYDVSLEEDLIEEIARHFGYDNIPNQLPRVRRTQTVIAPEERALRNLRQLLVGMGMTEAITLSFTNAEDLSRCQPDWDMEKAVRVANPISEKLDLMRPSLMPTMLSAAARNIRHGNERVRLFELGPVYREAENGDLPAQELHLGIVISGAASNEHWSAMSRTSDIYDLKGIVESTLSFLNIRKISITAVAAPGYAPGTGAGIYQKKKIIGTFGEIKKTALSHLDVSQAIYAAEITLDMKQMAEKTQRSFSAVPAFPSSTRDLAVIVESSTPGGALVEGALRAGGKHLAQAELIDIYTGKQISPGKKSLTLSLTYQSPERTLTDKDTQKSWKKILATLEREYGAELR